LLKDKKAVASPTLDIIDKDTFDYIGIQPLRPTYVTGFNFFLDTLPVPNNAQQEEKYRLSFAPIQ
jgi:hypothetical protein